MNAQEFIAGMVTNGPGFAAHGEGSVGAARPWSKFAKTEEGRARVTAFIGPKLWQRRRKHAFDFPPKGRALVEERREGHPTTP